jgi:hypothetical protein
MTAPDLLQNFGIGIIGGVVTLIGDRWLHRFKINRRLRRIAGEYAIVAIAPKRDTKLERVTIEHAGGLRFSIAASGGPTGNWAGDFIVREDFFDVAHGVYRYPGSTDWGQHELLFDSATDSIFVYGINRSKPGFMEPFSYNFVRRPSKRLRAG